MPVAVSRLIVIVSAAVGLGSAIVVFANGATVLPDATICPATVPVILGGAGGGAGDSVTVVVLSVAVCPSFVSLTARSNVVVTGLYPLARAIGVKTSLSSSCASVVGLADA